MAKIPKMPAQAVISTFRGKVDFYVHKGVPMARLWPSWKLKKRSPAVQVYIDLFTTAMHAWATLPANIREAYNQQAQESGLMGRDLWVRAFISGIRY